MTNKHFRAIAKAGGEPIYFGLEDLVGSLSSRDTSEVVPSITIWRDDPPNIHCKHWQLKDWLKDYDLQYNHEGDWYDYEI